MFLHCRPSTLATDLVNTRGLDFSSLAPVRYTAPNSYQMKCKLMSRLFILFFLSLSFSQLTAQTWEITPFIGGAEDVIEDANGNFFVAGVEEGQSVALKLDALGNILWKSTLPGRVGRTIDQLSNGDLVVAGILDGGTLQDTIESIFVASLSEAGQPIWDIEFNFNFEERVDKIFEANNGDLIITGSYLQEMFANNRAYLLRLDADGNFISRSEYANPRSIALDAIIELPNGDFLLSGVDGQANLTKIDAAGNILDNYFFWETNNLTSFHISPQPDGGYTVLSDGSESELVYARLDSNGDLLGIKPFAGDYIQGSNGGTATVNGDFAIAGYQWRTEAGPSDIFLLKMDVNGEKKWEKSYGRNNNGVFETEYFGSLKGTSDGGFILTGGSGSLAYIVKTDAFGNIYPNFVRGTVFYDENEDCTFAGTEVSLPHWVVQATGNGQTYYGVADEIGNYEINVPAGEYEVEVIPISAYWANACQDNYTINFGTAADTLTVDLAMKAIVLCPIIDVKIATSRLRRCFSNTYEVDYCNTGTSPSADSYIDLRLDEHLTVDSADLAYTMLDEQVYRFMIGTVGLGECGGFKVHTTLACDQDIPVGQVHCVEAHAFPDTLCLGDNQNWDGSEIVVDGFCRSDTVFFRIENIGVGDMASPQTYIVIEDQIILYEKNFQLDKGTFLMDTIIGMANEYTIIARQSDGSPFGDYPNITILNCGADSTSLRLHLPLSDASPFVDIHCLENVDSFDPNDKAGSPIGWGNEKLIFPNTEIEYKIRFQNTGTDTAYTVLIKDLIPATLDVKSLRPGSSSHPYTWSIEENNSLTFTFNNILLPDSSTNLSASQGFVNFTIAQQKDLPIGTTISNNAAIYFDFNEPIYTNQTLHKVGTLFSGVPTNVKNKPLITQQLIVFPNPFDKQTNFWIKDLPSQAVQLQLFDIMGQLIRTEQFPNTSFEMSRDGLPAGLYTYQLMLADGGWASGKVLIVDK